VDYMQMDETYETARHAKPVRCPRCRKSSLVLMFDSPARGMVCPHCHDKLIALRRHASELTIKRSVSMPRAGKKKPALCPRCGIPAQVLLFDSPQAGMVCPGCHDDLTRFRQEVIGLIPDVR